MSQLNSFLSNSFCSFRIVSKLASIFRRISREFLSAAIALAAPDPPNIEGGHTFLVATVSPPKALHKGENRTTKEESIDQYLRDSPQNLLRIRNISITILVPHFT